MENIKLLITEAINRTNSEQGSNTPDFILSEFLVNCLEAFNREFNDPGSIYDSLLGSPRFAEDCRVAYTSAIEARNRYYNDKSSGFCTIKSV